MKLIQLRRVDLNLGAVGLLQHQLVVGKSANELRDHRVGHLLDLIENPRVGRQGLQPPHQAGRRELPCGRCGENRVVATIGIRIVGHRLYGGDCALLHLDLSIRVELREVGALRHGDAPSLRSDQELALHLVVGWSTNDVVAVLRRDHRRDLTRLERNQRFLELPDHLSLREDSKRSALSRRTLVLAVRVRKGGEIRRVNPGAKGIDLFLHPGLLRIVHPLCQQENVLGGENLSVRPLALGGKRILDTPALRHDVVPFARLQVGDRRPHHFVDQLGIAERIVVGGGYAEQLIVHPHVRDRLCDRFGGRCAGLTEQRRELVDGELRASGPGDPVGMRVESVLEAGASRECKRREGGNSESPFHSPWCGLTVVRQGAASSMRGQVHRASQLLQVG